MSSRTQTRTEWNLVSVALTDAYTDFILSRQAMRCAPATMQFYKFTLGAFLAWLERQGVTAPHELTARLVRQYLAELAGRGKADATVRDHARAIRTLAIFWEAEKYISEPLKFAMPRVAGKRLPVLTAEQVQTIVKACNVRDRALVLFLADTGLRRAEVCALNWADVDFSSGLVRVERGKGGKARSAVVGATARVALLRYRRTVRDTSGAVFESKKGGRFTGTGLMLIFRRLSKRTGIHVTPHALRRTFVILSLRGGMDVLHLQALLGHASLDMVQHYAQMVDDDLLAAHRVHSPIDNLSRLR